MRNLILAAALMTSAIPYAAIARPAEIADLLRQKDVSSPDIAPDGSQVVYTVRETDVEKDKTETHIWLAQWDGSGTRQLTHRAGETESNPKFSPDGRVIAFISGRDADEDGAEDTPDKLWFLPLAGGEAYALEGIDGSVSDFAFSPDGSKLALIVQDAKPRKDKAKKDRPEPIVIDRYRFKQDGVGYLDNRRERLWLYDIESGKAQRLTDGDFDEAMPVFSPDGSRVAFVSRRFADAERSPDFNLYVARIDQPGKAPLQVTRYAGADNDPGFGSYPAWSPDGSRIAYIRTGDPKLIWYATNDLAVVPSSGGEGLVLTDALDRNVSDPIWSADGSAISFIVEDDGVQRLAAIAANGGEVRDMRSGEWVLADPSMADNGRVALRVGRSGAPDEIYGLSGTELRQLTRHNAALADEIDMGKVERISFASKDGTKVHGFLKTPPGWRKGTRLPTALIIHGGPTAQYDVGFDMMLEVMAARGYAVVYVNPRGSTGRGQDFAAAINAAWGSVDVEDVLAAVDHVVDEGVADPDKLVIGGWSYGGMLTNYTIASDQRFKAAVSGASISNIVAGYGTDHYVYEYDIELGYPWENREAWDRISYPFFENQRIVTPTLFMVGGADVNVPTLASEQMYQALRTRGIETQLVIYPEQSHGIRRPSFIVDRMERWLKWYDDHVK
ncbi:S9 family peptidase [Qipengyuania sp. 6B39]|uniref:S9 family peptidase n=1 Tax=Qipengyuania proteolytica TaxID=2867239 RepID=UPI001C8AA628|nr:S9 family peptidase [Qipengyuania proteolytica]MBX7495963.1 S9 family peptidase [Qipengyuania proteolytica]